MSTVHTKPNRGEHVTWLTPPSILRNLGEFDLDPCSAPSPRPWVTAKRHIELPEDGLAVEWEGRVWLNPPYGTGIMEPWLEKMAKHRSGVLLTFARTETEWFRQYIWEAATALLFVHGRLYFHYPDGTEAKGNSGGPSVLAAYSAQDALALCDSGIRGAYVPGWYRL